MNFLSFRSLVVEVMSDCQKNVVHFFRRYRRRAWMQ